MAIPKRLFDSLHQSLGDAAGADMVNWMQIADDERSRTEALRGDIAELRQHMTAGFAAVGIEAAERETRIVSRMEERFTDAIKWSFIFWATTTLTLVGLILSRT